MTDEIQPTPDEQKPKQLTIEEALAAKAKSSCNSCYGRGYVGWVPKNHKPDMFEYKEYTICKCVNNFIKRQTERGRKIRDKLNKDKKTGIKDIVVIDLATEKGIADGACRENGE